MNAEAIAFAAERIGILPEHFLPATAIVRSKDGQPESVLVFHNYKPMHRGSEVEVSFASDNPLRFTRTLLRDLFHYVFVQLECSVLRAQHRDGDAKVAKLLDGLGFTREGNKRRGWNGETDAVFWSMLPDECRWLDYLRDAVPEVN